MLARLYRHYAEENIYSSNVYLQCIIFGLFFFYTTIFSTMFNSIQPSLASLFTKQQIGGLLMTLFLSSTVMTIPGGYLLDRVDIKKLCLWMLGLYWGAIVVFLIYPSFAVAEIAFIVLGACGSFSFNSVMRYMALTVPRKKFATMTGVMFIVGNVACILAQTPMAILCAAIGWQMLLMLIIIMGAMIAAAIYFFVPSVTQMPDEQKLLTKKAIHLLFSQLWAIIKIPRNWFGVIYIGMINLVITVLGGAWNNVYLVNSYQMNFIHASMITIMIYLGVIVGSPLTGWLTDKFARYKPILLAGGGGACSMMAVIIWGHLTFTQLIICYFLLGICAGTQPAAYAVLKKTKLGLTGIKLGFIGTINAAITGIVIYLFSYLLTVHVGAGGENYQLAISALFTAFITSTVCAGLI